MRPTLFLAALFACGGVNATTFVVTSTDDTCELSQQCLRRAIALANANPDADAIVFDIPGDPAQPKRILLGSPLVVTQPVVIDGYTQPGASPNTLEEGTNAQVRIVLDASGAGGAASAMSVKAGPTDIRGVTLVGADYAGLWIDVDAAEVELRGSFVGVEPDGVTAAPNRWGLAVNGEFNVIGGVEPADRNLISGNRWSGLTLYGNRSIRNAVVGNLIGTDRHGAPVLGNGWSGVQVTFARLTRIGGYSRALQNVIAGNGHSGVQLHGTEVQNIEVASRIFANSPIYGAIGNDCTVANDPGDIDGGGNECLNHPVISSARVTAGELVIEGAFDSVPNRPGRVALYGNTQACAGGAGGGGETRHFLGYVAVATDAGGHAAFRFVAPPGAYTSVAAIAGVGQEDLYVDSTSRVSPCVGIVHADRIFADAFGG